jgi:lactate permease
MACARTWQALQSPGHGRLESRPSAPPDPMPWIQVYAPIRGSIGLSAAVAALPLGVVFVCLAILRIKAFKAVLLALAAAVALSVLRVGNAREARRPRRGSTARPSASSRCTSSSCATLFLYNITVKGGQFEVIRASLAERDLRPAPPGPPHRVLLRRLHRGRRGIRHPRGHSGRDPCGTGLPPFYAAGICLVANTAPVAFGAIGTAVVALGGVMGLNDAGLMKLSTMVGPPAPVRLPHHPGLHRPDHGPGSGGPWRSFPPSPSAA